MSRRMPMRMDPSDPKGFLENARWAAYKLTRLGHRTTTMGEVAIADAINRLAAAVEKMAEPKELVAEADTKLNNLTGRQCAQLFAPAAPLLKQCQVRGQHVYNEDGMEVHVAQWSDSTANYTVTWSLLHPVTADNQGSDEFPM